MIDLVSEHQRQPMDELEVSGILPGRGWLVAALHALPVTGLVLGLFIHWFAVADRYAMFLYDHLGASPFDRVTRGRYWMAGLVASGIVMAAYVFVNWAVGRATTNGGRRYTAPAWWRVWAVCAPMVTVGVPLITMGVNEPTLPPGLAGACVVATLAGLGLALLPGKVAAERPMKIVWLALDGMGLMPPLVLIRALELPGRGLISPAAAWGAALGGILGGGIWLLMVTAIRSRQQGPHPSAGSVLLSGLGVSYILMPLVHHLLATPPGYRYISTSSDFFADRAGLQLVAVLVAAVMALGVTWLRVRVGQTSESQE